jgi:two-component system, cell cycle sensor histidine kinase and response regulator CckA
VVKVVTLQRNSYTGDQSPRTILLVEDEPFVREATSGILRHAGFEVLPAENARQALQVYEDCAERIDLVMTDMMMPGATGQQLSCDLRRHSPDLPVLLTSGYSNQEFDVEVPALRTFFLAKPYCRRTLLEKIENILAATTHAFPTSQAG